MRANTTRNICILALGAALLIAGWGAYVNRAFFHDDAYIGLRYARNLTEGHGLVWNQGERVEGCTNFLFTLLVAGLGALRVPLVLAARSVNALAFAALAAYAWIHGTKLVGGSPLRRPLGLVAFLIVVTSFPLIVWVLGGLEGPLFAALVAGGVWTLRGALNRQDAGKSLAVSGLLFGLACATRLDGALFVMVSLLFLAFEPTPTGGRVRRIGTFLVAFGVVFAPSLIWRWAYYGSPVPNTYWVKASGFTLERMQDGLRYAFALLARPPFTFVLAGAALMLAVVRRRLDRATLYVPFAVMLYLAYVVCVGGCHMPACRLALPLIPIAALFLGELLVRLWPPVRGTTACVIIVCLLPLLALQIRDPGLNPRRTDPAAFVGAIVGRYIGTTWPPGSLVALNTAGSTPYYAAGLRFIDMLGLNDVHIARREIDERELAWQKIPGHLKGDGAYVLSRQPDYIIIGPAEGTTADDAWFLSGLEMSRDPRLQAEYECRCVQLDAHDVPGFAQHQATRTGVLTLTYYERRGSPDGGDAGD